MHAIRQVATGDGAAPDSDFQCAYQSDGQPGKPPQLPEIVRENLYADTAHRNLLLVDCNVNTFVGGASGTAALVGVALCCPSAPAPSSAEAHPLRDWRDL